MRAGKLNRRITVQVRTTSRDAAGGRTESWAEAFKAWAELVKQSTSEGTIADAERAVDQRQFRIRWRSGLSAGTHRILYGGDVFDILGIEDEGIQTGLLVTCRNHQSLTA